jgi:hypothetical protein
VNWSIKYEGQRVAKELELVRWRVKEGDILTPGLFVTLPAMYAVEARPPNAFRLALRWLAVWCWLLSGGRVGG